MAVTTGITTLKQLLRSVVCWQRFVPMQVQFEPALVVVEGFLFTEIFNCKGILAYMVLFFFFKGNISIR